MFSGLLISLCPFEIVLEVDYHKDWAPMMGCNYAAAV